MQLLFSESFSLCFCGCNGNTNIIYVCARESSEWIYNCNTASLFIGAVILLGLGVIGIYIKKIYEEVKGRPRYIISRVIGKKDINK